MENFRCFLCDQFIPNGLNSLSSHFINAHELTVKRGVDNKGFICGQDNYQRQFSHFFSLWKHIKKDHTQSIPNEHYQEIPENFNNIIVNECNANNRNIEEHQNVADNINNSDDHAILDECEQFMFLCVIFWNKKFPLSYEADNY